MLDGFLSLMALALSVAAFLIAWLMDKRLIHSLAKRGVLDIPNQRSSHTVPVPRGGGIGIVAAVVATWATVAIVFEVHLLWAVILPALSIATIGWLDDSRGGLSTGLRFAVHLACAIVPVWFFGPLRLLPLPAPLDVYLPLWVGWLLSVLWVVGVTNIYNFLDGIDGYAGTQGLLAAVMLTLLFLPIGHTPPVFVLPLTLAFACAGFLYFNWHPARIFMGDVGSGFLGYLFAVFPFFLQGYGLDSKSIIVAPLLLFMIAVLLWFFLSDGLFTMVRRMVKGEKPWTPHRSHLYQRLTIAGWRHDQVVGLVAALCLVLYAVLYLAGNWWWVVGTMLLLFVVYLAIVLLAEKKQAKLRNSDKPFAKAGRIDI